MKTKFIVAATKPARAIQKPFRMRVRSLDTTSVTFSAKVYYQVDHHLVRMNGGMFAAKAGTYEEVFEKLHALALELPNHFSEAAHTWLGTGSVLQQAA